VIRRTALLAKGGGRVDWCAARNLIAFDRMPSRQSADVYVISPDGSGERCVTCDVPGLPAGIRGQPAWDPTCQLLLIQVTGRHATGSFLEWPGWGIHADLWVLAVDRGKATRLLQTPRLGAALHPHFSADGKRVFWSVRESTGTTIRLGLPQLDRENQWDGWHLAIARFQTDPYRLTERVDLFKGSGGFYEAHALIGGRIYFSHTAGGRPFVEAGYSATDDGSGRTDLTKAPGQWNEHVSLSPGGKLIAFNSSRSHDWRHPPELFRTLRTELWARPAQGGEPVRLTSYNDEAERGIDVVTADYAWGPQGDQLAVYYVHKRRGAIQRQAIDILTLDQRY
jgi:hypothetical protein